MKDAALEGCVTVIGSGTLLPSSARSSSAYHLALPSAGPVQGDSSKRSRSILLDCGNGTLHALARHRVDWEAIDVVLITHYHGDHVGDLVALLAAWRFQGRTRPLTLLGPSDFRDFLEALASVHGPWVSEPGFPLQVVALGPNGSWSDAQDSLRVESFPTPHTDVSICVRLSGSWGTLGYTGDTGPSDSVAGFLTGCDVLLAECALTDPPRFEGHLTPASLVSLAAQARPSLLVVTHVYPPTEPHLIVEEVGRRWGGRVEAAHDGMTLTISPGDVDVDRPARGE